MVEALRLAQRGHRPGRRRSRQGQTSWSGHRWQLRCSIAGWPRCRLGRPDWRDDLRRRPSRCSALSTRPRRVAAGDRQHATSAACRIGVLLADDDAVRETADALADRRTSPVTTSRSAARRCARGMVLVHRDGPAADRDAALSCCAEAARCPGRQRFTLVDVPIVDIRDRADDAPSAEIVDGAIELCARRRRRPVRDRRNVCAWCWRPLHWWNHCCERGSDGDIAEAEAAIDTVGRRPHRPGVRPARICRCCDCAPCWHAPRATTTATGTIGIATGRWPPTWALRATCSGPRR